MWDLGLPPAPTSVLMAAPQWRLFLASLRGIELALLVVVVVVVFFEHRARVTGTSPW